MKLLLFINYFIRIKLFTIHIKYFTEITLLLFMKIYWKTYKNFKETKIFKKFIVSLFEPKPLNFSIQTSLLFIKYIIQIT